MHITKLQTEPLWFKFHVNERDRANKLIQEHNSINPNHSKNSYKTRNRIQRLSNYKINREVEKDIRDST